MLVVGEDMFFPNLLPLVSPIDSCSANELPSCLNVPADAIKRSASDASNDYMEISDVVELHHNSKNTKNEVTPNTSCAPDPPQATDNNPGTITEASESSPSGSVTPVRMSSPQMNSSVHNETSDTVSDLLTTPTRQDMPALSNLDRGKRAVCHTVSSPGERSLPGESPVLLRHRLGESPLARRKNITSSPVHQRGELGVLQPLSPEHGTEMNDQYDFLRRTLSHSHRRFSTRRRPNRKERRPEEGSEEENTAPAAAQANEVNTPEQRKRWKDILISNEVSPTQRRSEGMHIHM